MTQQTIAELGHEFARRRRRDSEMPFPSITFEEAMFLPENIIEHGADGEIPRLTLLRILDMAPSSKETRALIGDSARYGLTEGSSMASSLAVTAAGRLVSDSDFSSSEIKAKGFELAIGRFEPFRRLYDRVKEGPYRGRSFLQRRIPLDDFPDADRDRAVDVFIANLRLIGLIEDVAGHEYVRDIKHMVQATPGGGAHAAMESGEEDEDATGIANNGNTTVPSNRPALHIDIEVHIDPASSAEQIDQIFASMAKHLYGEGS